MRSKEITPLVLNIIITIVIAYTVMPIISRFFSEYLTTYAYLVVLLSAILLIVFLRGISSLNRSFFLVLPFILFRLLGLLFVKQDILLWAYGTLTTISPVLIGCFLVNNYDKKNIKFFSVLTIVVIAITILSTYLGQQKYPYATRFLAMGSGIGDSLLRTYDWANIGGFEFSYSLVIVYSALIYIFKKNQFRFIWMILLALIFGVYFFEIGYTIAFIMYLISTVFIFLKRDLRIRSVILIIFISIILAILFFGIISDILNRIASIANNKFLAERLQIIAGGKDVLEAAEDNRWELYLKSLTFFIQHPLFGGMISSASIGGHSFIFDNIAQYGLTGLILLFLMYRNIYRTFYRPYKNETGFGFLFWVFLEAIIIATLNTGMLLNALCLYIPVLLTLTHKKGGNKSENSLGSKLDTK